MTETNYVEMSDQELADASVDATHAWYADGSKEDDVIVVENEIAYRLQLDPDETEQGFTAAAQEKVNAFVTKHTTKVVLRHAACGTRVVVDTDGWYVLCPKCLTRNPHTIVDEEAVND